MANGTGGARRAPYVGPNGKREPGIYVRRAADYVAPGVEVTFATIVASARQRGEVAIGYRQVVGRETSAAGHGVTINPAKSARVTLGERDAVIVLAE